MLFRKVAQNVRVEAGAAAVDVDYAQAPKPGGRMCKNVQVMVKVTASSTNAKVGIKIKHGPDGVAFKDLATQATTVVPADKLFVLDTSASAIVGEFVQIVVVGGGTAAGDWAVVDVYEMRKPF